MRPKKRRKSAGCWLLILPGSVFVVWIWAASRAWREDARRSSCGSGLKSLWVAISMYSQDYDERYPIARFWMDATLPYTKNEWMYRCSGQSPDRPQDFGYAYNSRLSGKKSEKIKAPETVPLVYDSWKTTRNSHDPFLSLPDPPRHQRNNILFVDGHLDREKSSASASPEP